MRDDYHHTHPWAVIANGDENTVMELLKNRSKQTIVDLLESLQQPKKVKVVTMDMWAGYRTAVQEVLPHALVVVDKFHVVRMANDELDSVRRSITRTSPYTLKQNRSIFLARGDNLSERAADIRDDWLENTSFRKCIQPKRGFLPYVRLQESLRCGVLLSLLEKQYPKGTARF